MHLVRNKTKQDLGTMLILFIMIVPYLVTTDLSVATPAGPLQFPLQDSSHIS